MNNDQEHRTHRCVHIHKWRVRNKKTMKHNKRRQVWKKRGQTHTKAIILSYELSYYHENHTIPQHAFKCSDALLLSVVMWAASNWPIGLLPVFVRHLPVLVMAVCGYDSYLLTEWSLSYISSHSLSLPVTFIITLMWMCSFGEETAANDEDDNNHGWTLAYFNPIGVFYHHKLNGQVQYSRPPHCLPDDIDVAN